MDDGGWVNLWLRMIVIFYWMGLTHILGVKEYININ